MASRDLGGLSNFPIAERDNSANDCEERAEYPEPDKYEASYEALLHKPESPKSALHPAPPPQKAVGFCPLPNLLHHLKWWLTKCFADQLDIFYMDSEKGIDEQTEIQLKFQIFTKFLRVCNYTHSGYDSPKSHSSKPRGNNSEDLRIE